MKTELLVDSGHSRADLRMIERAMKKWQIPDELLEVLPKAAGSIALKGTERGKIAAMRVLMSMKEANDRLELAESPPQRTVEHRHIHELGPVTVENLAEHKRRLLEEIGS